MFVLMGNMKILLYWSVLIVIQIVIPARRPQHFVKHAIKLPNSRFYMFKATQLRRVSAVAHPVCMLILLSIPPAAQIVCLLAPHAQMLLSAKAVSVALSSTTAHVWMIVQTISPSKIPATTTVISVIPHVPLALEQQRTVLAVRKTS